jgi:hypothetical protein
LFDLDELLPFLRQTIDDRDADGYDYPDEELRSDLRFGVISLEARWEQGYTISTQTVDGVAHFFIDPDPLSWMQVLIVLETAYKIKAAVPDHSIRLPSISITSSTKKDDMDRLKEMIDDIMYERRYKTAGFVWNSFDNFFTYPDES